MSPYPSQISVDEAIEFVCSKTPMGPPERVPIDLALGRTLAKRLASRADHPTVDNSAMDGFACRMVDTAEASEDDPAILAVVGEVPAGRPYQRSVGPSEAVRIYTGGAVPCGADAIVPVEVTREREGRVEVLEPARRNHIRPKAQDLKAGRSYLEPGTRLDSASIGLVAAMGHATLSVVRKPRVGILATGSEVVAPGGILKPGQVFNANAYSVAALVRAAGGEPVHLPPVPDDAGALEGVIGENLGLDLLLTSGGVSMGRYDLVRDLLLDGGEVFFWKVAMRPGGPVMFGRWRGLPILGLPGNPVSSIVVFLLLGRTFLDTFLGRSDPLPYHRREKARAGQTFRASGAKETFQRVRILRHAGSAVAITTGNQSSGVLRSMVEADALALLPGGTEVAEGDDLEVIPLHPHLG